MGKDTLKNFLNDFISFALYHYKFGMKIEDVLNHSCRELDIAYGNCGYFSFIDEYYEEFIKRKKDGEFKEITILKKDGDYLVKFDKSILENK